MTRNRSITIICALIMAAIMVIPATVAYAQTGPATPPPIPVVGPRLAPPVIPHTDVIAGLVSPLPAQSLLADAYDGGRTQEAPGRGIRQTISSIAYGWNLYSTANACNNFNPDSSWAMQAGHTDIYTDWFAGWAPFAINNGPYQAKNVAFTMERNVGPGSKFGPNNESAKIASNQPYAAGFGSPRIPVPAGYEGGKVMVSVKYLIWDHDQGGKLGGPDGLDYDWASMGVKPGADGNTAVYVNGYVRGESAQMTNTVDLGNAKDVMVLIQGQSPGALNSNIYFDDVAIGFSKGDKVKWLTDCTTAESIK